MATLLDDPQYGQETTRPSGVVASREPQPLQL